jgi:hypothetical protein
MVTGLVSLVELSRQFRQRGVGGIDLEVVLNIGVGGPGAAAVGPWDAAIALGLPTGAPRGASRQYSCDYRGDATLLMDGL